VIELVAAEAARTVIGSSMGYFIGKWLGRKEQRNRCSFLWDLEMEVSPKLLKKLIDQEVKEGCITPEEADDRFAKILEIRQRYGLMGGADTFVVASANTATVHTVKESVPTSSPAANAGTPGNPPPVEKLAADEALERLAKQEVGPPTALQPKPKKKLLGIF